MKIIILAGGKGTRLYPLSTPEHPKQFLKLTDDVPMIVATIRRFKDVTKLSDIIIITNTSYEALTKKILTEYGLQEVNVITEPCAKNTAPAIALGIKYGREVLGSTNNEAFAIMPSDHIIYPINKFIKAVKLCEEIAVSGSVATIGIKPDCPDTGYGYINADGSNKINKVIKFVEKPCSEKAKQYLQCGGYFWNSGIYTITSKVFESELNKYAPELYNYFVSKTYSEFTNIFNELKSISIDYAISEKSDNIYMVCTDMVWSDIGNWDNYYKYSKKDENGNVILGNVHQSGCENCLLIALDSELSVINEKDKVVINNGEKIFTISLEKFKRFQ